MSTHPSFKFVSVRPPGPPAFVDISHEIPPVALDRSTTLVRDVQALDGQRRARARAIDIARRLLASERYVLTAREREGHLRNLFRIETALRGLPATVEIARVRATIEDSVGEEAARMAE